jgi:hypothetical protein
MATNNLTPKSSNMLLYDAAQKGAGFQELVKFLGAKMPSFDFGYLTPGTRGEFSNETGNIRLNNEYLDRGYTPNAAVPTFTHELTHASILPLAQLYQDNVDAPKTPEMRQFLNAYEKLAFNPKGQGLDKWPRGAMASKLGGSQWFGDNEEYRTSESELPAQAMGNVLRKTQEAPMHLDPTLATEFRVLLDLATRAQGGAK